MTPRSRIAPSAAKTASTTVGASPSEGSSSSSTSGPRDERPRDRQLLLLAAGERARLARRANSASIGKSS